MTEIIRNKYKSEICEGCNGYGYVRFRNGGDEDCSECDGEGMVWASSEDVEGEDDSMTLKLPETIRIGSIDYVVNYTKGLSASDGLLGQINYSRCSINIEASLPRSKTREVLAHEIAHGILFEAGYEEHSEEQANRIGKVLAMLLRDNDFTFMREDE